MMLNLKIYYLFLNQNISNNHVIKLKINIIKIKIINNKFTI